MDAIILASSSPRRRELLIQAGIPFTVMPSEVDEEHIEYSGTPEGMAEYLACIKAQDVAEKVDKGLVLGADTIVVCEGDIFGKPSDSNDAKKMLERLSGREHCVITGLALIDAANGMLKKGYEMTMVRFSALTAEKVEAYINTGEPFGKAGAYAIQGYGALLVEGIKGCYSNVVGLPLYRLGYLLEELGIKMMQ